MKLELSPWCSLLKGKNELKGIVLYKFIDKEFVSFGLYVFRSSSSHPFGLEVGSLVLAMSCAMLRLFCIVGRLN